MSTSERDLRKRTFDAVASGYDRARPGYPEQLFEDVISLSGLRAGGRILEIGPGTGHATLPFARRGYLIDGIELGAAMAERWRQNLEGFANATITIGQFEELEPPDGHYDLVIAASAFHWIDPAIGYGKVAAALKVDGSIALWWNRHALREADKQYIAAATPIYSLLAPQLTDDDVLIPPADAVPEPTGARIRESGLFGPVIERRYEWSRTFETETFIELLDSFSRYRVMDPQQRARLFDELRALIDGQFGGSVTRGMVSFLYVARRSQ